MTRVTKRIIVMVAFALFAICTITGIAFSVNKTVKATSELTVTGIERTYIEGYNDNAGGFHTEFLITFGQNVFSGYADDADLTFAFPELGSKIYHHDNTNPGTSPVALGSIAGYSAVKFSDNTAKVSIGVLAGYSKFTIDSGLTLGSYTLAEGKTLYIDEYWVSTETEPEYRPVSVFQMANGAYFRPYIGFSRYEEGGPADTALLGSINGTSVATYYYDYWPYRGVGASNTSVGLDLSSSLVADIVTNGGVWIFPTGFKYNFGTATTQYYGFAIEAGNHQNSWATMSQDRWKPINGFADMVIDYVSGTTYSLTLTNTKDLTNTSTAADLISNFSQGDDITAFMAKWSSLPNQMTINGTNL